MSKITLEEFIKYIDNAADSVYIDVEQLPSVYKRKRNKAIAEAFKQAKQFVNLPKDN